MDNKKVTRKNITSNNLHRKLVKMSMLKDFKVAVKNNTMMEFIYENYSRMNEEEKKQILVDMAFAISESRKVQTVLLQEISNHD